MDWKILGAGSALAWFNQGEMGAGLSFSSGQKIKRVTQNDRPDSIFLESSLPEWLQREGDIPLFLNGISGLGSPFWRPIFDSRFVGAGEVWQQAVAVVESIVFLLQMNLEGMTAYVSMPACMRISGGLDQLDGLCQKLANLADIPVIRPAHSEATARGCAFLLAGCPDDWQSLELDAVFRAQTEAGLTDRYARWKVLMEINP